MALSGDVASNISADADATAHKRKHEDSISQQDQQEDSSAARNKQIQTDLLQVLERHDTSPSFLQHTLRPTSASSEPSNKKARLDEPRSDASTIAARLSTASYTSLQSLKCDASRVSEDLIASIRNRSKHDSSVARPSVEELKQIHRIQHFEAMLREFVDSEDKPVKEEEEKEAQEEHVPSKRRVGTVLTLFGNAPTPKQLFSSVQNTSADHEDPAIKAELPVEEMNLPIGITATNIVPVRANDSKNVPTFEDTFAPPYNLSALLPPKAAKRSTTRDTTLKWEFKDPIQRNSRKGGYTVQSLTVGKWLGYGGVDPPTDSTREKRKQRDRALSGGEDREPRPTQAARDDALAKAEAALFRRAYSSYAPPYDNSSVVVPEMEKNSVWWSKVGHKRFNDTFAIDPALLDEKPSSVPIAILDEAEKPDLNDEELEKVIANLDEVEQMEVETEPVTSKTDIEHVQRQISELLETLASHQRIRNATIPPATASRVPISPGPVSSKIGKPDEPSEDEIATYDKLRREIAYLVLKLPPYAVAKLDGDQLSDLGVSTLITFHSRDIRGSLEEDLVTRQAKAAASQTAQSLASLSNRPSSSAGQHYSTTAQRTPAIGQAANTRYGQQYTGRPPVSAPSFNRSTSNQQSYGTPGGATARSYGGSNTYTRAGAPQSTYGQANGSQYYQPQRPLQTTNGFGSLSQFQQPTSSQQQGRTPTFPPTYPPRSQGVANYSISTGNNNSTSQSQQHAFNRTASPAQSGVPGGGYSSPMLPAQQQLAAAQQRQQGGMYPGQQQGSGGGGGNGRGTPVNGYPSQPNTPVHGYQTQQQRNVAPRPTSGTPQPASTTTAGDVGGGGGGGGGGGVGGNGTSDAAAATSLHGGGGGGGGGDFEGGGPEWCHYCEEYLRPREALAGHRCEVLRCRKCNKHYTYREVFKKHVDGCVG